MKRVLLPVFEGVARLAGRLSKLQRVWALAVLRSRLASRVPASVVILSSPELHGSGDITLGENLFLYRELYLETQGNGRIAIGDGAVLSRGVHVVAHAAVTIGVGTMIGEYSSIRDANHVYRGPQPIRDAGHSARPINIGKNVWVGRGAAILAGVTIGDGAVIGANSVVTRDVAAGEVVGGAPARPLLVRRAA